MGDCQEIEQSRVLKVKPDQDHVYDSTNEVEKEQYGGLYTT